ncbi:MAG TPA: alpha/beta hydrolase [Tahibacter sp.]|nr:alpha/beta hydrolase [Tahibacter sp.]
MLASLFGALLAAATATPSAAATAPTKFVAVGADRIAYRTIGSGPPIVLVTRMRGTIDTWDPLFLDTLARHRTVVTVDYPGVGHSAGTLPDDVGKAAAFVDDFATAIRLDRYAILGWSWGGLVAQALVVERPARVTHAVLVGTNPPGAVEHAIQAVFIERAVKPVNDLADEEVLFFEPASDASRAAAAASHARIYARSGVTEKIPSTPAMFQTYFKAGEAFHADATGRRDALTRTRLPILVVCGDHDVSTAGQNWFALIGRMRNAQFLYFSETGHGPQHQHPELAADYIVDFLERTAPAGGAR